MTTSRSLMATAAITAQGATCKNARAIAAAVAKSPGCKARARASFIRFEFGP